MCYRRSKRQAFTLIEVLVVCAIISLLVAILIPSLARAREQAKIATCKTSLQQVGNMVSMYQAAEQNYVPVLFNWYARYPMQYPDGTVRNAPARVRFASVALRRYDKTSSRLPSGYDPEADWDDAKRDEYAKNVLGKHWVCPFVRDRPEVTTQQGGTISVTGQSGTANYSLESWVGIRETYTPWLWEEVVRGKPVRGAQEIHPNDPVDGRPKYSVITFNRVIRDGSAEPPPIGGCGKLYKDVKSDYVLLNAHRSWSVADAQRRFSASLSQMTMLFCSQGNFLAFDHYIDNPGSHLAGGRAGTNTVFADGHVEWVDGTHIGWP